MKALITKIFFGILIIGLLAACSGTQPTETPASSPTEQLAAPTDTPASSSPEPAAPTSAPLPTDTVVVATLAVPPTESSGQSAAVSYSNDVLPILQSRCMNCHGGDRLEEGLNLTTFANMMTGSDNGPIVTPGDAENSLLAELVVSQKMPKRGPKLTPPQVQTLIDWINQGALDN